MQKFAKTFGLVYACLLGWGLLGTIGSRITPTGVLALAVLALIFTFAWWKDPI